MPIDFKDIQNLPEEARHELPGGNDKGKYYRGTLAWWVITVLFSISIILLWNANSGYKQQIKDCKEEKSVEIQKKDAAIERLINKLEHISNRIEDVEAKADTVAEKSLQYEKTFNTSKKLLKNAIR